MLCIPVFRVNTSFMCSTGHNGGGTSMCWLGAHRATQNPLHQIRVGWGLDWTELWLAKLASCWPLLCQCALLIPPTEWVGRSGGGGILSTGSHGRSRNGAFQRLEAGSEQVQDLLDAKPVSVLLPDGIVTNLDMMKLAQQSHTVSGRPLNPQQPCQSIKPQQQRARGRSESHPKSQWA